MKPTTISRIFRANTPTKISGAMGTAHAKEPVRGQPTSMTSRLRLNFSTRPVEMGPMYLASRSMTMKVPIKPQPTVTEAFRSCFRGTRTTKPMMNTKMGIIQAAPRFCIKLITLWIACILFLLS